jgi:hypothetical protein
MSERFVEQLRSDLTHRLDDLERESAAIKRVLQALKDPRDDGGSTHRTRVLDDRLLRKELRRTPGARASVIALSHGWPADAVSDRLRKLEAAGAVERDGLGWRLSRGRVSPGATADDRL